jgi:hypothetical protein
MVERFRSLPRFFQVTTVLALLAICGCCGIVGLALVWPTADDTPDRAADRSVPTLQPTFTPIGSADTSVPPTDTPTRTLPPTDTSTPLPTATPMPTSTPLPTPTSLPTATPQPPALTQPPSTEPASTPPPVGQAQVVIDPSCCQFNAPGDDGQNKEEEWVCFRNSGGAAANMSAWTMSDEHGWIYTFPEFVLSPATTVRVVTGCGTNTSDTLFWCKEGASAVWNNDGDIVQLFDASSSLVATYQYP